MISENIDVLKYLKDTRLPQANSIYVMLGVKFKKKNYVRQHLLKIN
jgi:hypothetical protein